MKKFKGWFIALFIIILIIIVLWVIKTPIAASYLSAKLKTDVSISNIGFSSNRIMLNNFSIKNPKKMKSKYAFIAKKIEINYSFSKFFSSPSIVDSILVKDINLNIECENPLCTKNNWTSLVVKVNDEEQKKRSKNELIIKKLVMSNMDVQIAGLGFPVTKTKKTNIAHIEFNNVSSKKGFPTQQLIAAIFRSAGLKDYLKGFLDTKGMIENIIQTFKGISDNSFEESLKNM